MREPGNEALLVLSDGTVFEGEAVGFWDPARPKPATGELVFNTAMTGYQEILTDPSYAGQVVCFTYPHIGNYGVSSQDQQARKPHCKGLVVRELVATTSSWRAETTLGDFLVAHHLPGVAGVDTRRLTRHLRESGAIPCAFAPVSGPAAVEEGKIFDSAREAQGTDGTDLASEVSTREGFTLGTGERLIVAYDFGMKAAILERLKAFSRVEVVPAWTSAEEALRRKPDGVFLSNGPGDPAALSRGIEAVRGLLGEVPVFGICLGIQVLALALGGRTYKLRFGHHGANHPVRDLKTGRVLITSENHNYAVDEASLPMAVVTHRNLNDGVVEGFEVPSLRAAAVQCHPEASPGPHDALGLFSTFRDAVSEGGLSGA